MPIDPYHQTHTSDLSLTIQTVLPAQYGDAIQQAIAASKRPNTLQAYQSDLAQFGQWCSSQGWQALPATPETVAAYLVKQRQHLKLTTLRRRLATISKAHQIAGLPNPCKSPLVTDTVKGLQNMRPEAPKRALALTADNLRTILATINSDSIAGKRDRALLLAGWCGALRRSEIAALRWGDLNWLSDGVVLTVMGSKTDKAGTGQQVPLAAETKASKVCPVKALRSWQQALSALSPDLIKPDQPVFRQINRHGSLGGSLTGHAVNAIISRKAEQASLTGLTGHSLRRGLIQAASVAGVADTAIMQTSRHKSLAMLRTYQGDAGLLVRAASKGLLT